MGFLDKLKLKKWQPDLDREPPAKNTWPDHIITLNDACLSIISHDGDLIEEHDYDINEQDLLDQLVCHIALNKQDSEKHPLQLNMDDDLNLMAVIESAYLSARTSSPEEPSRLLNIIKSEPTVS